MKKILDWLLRPHPLELHESVWFQEEARAERVANLIRGVYMLLWLPVVIAIARDHPYSANVGNVGVGVVHLGFVVAYHLCLRARPYRSPYKYVSTAVDVLLTTTVIFMYHHEMGYSTVLKAPTFINYLAILVLAAFRFSSALPIYVGGLSLLAYGAVFAAMLLTQDVAFGTPLDLFTTPKINLVYQLIRLTFVGVFAFVGFVLTRNVRRLVHLRVEETLRAVEEKARRERTQSLFERYFTPEIAGYLAEHPQDLGGTMRHVTVVFSDLRGFTALSEGLGPAGTVALLNEVFERLVGVVFKHGGTLDKFYGDGMLVVFGVPDARPDDALRAVLAAREMVEEVRALGGDHRLELGVAVHTGDVVFGNVGSSKRMDLTVIGDAVNTASRMEALNKEFGTSIVLSGATLRELDGRVVVRELPATRLRGKLEEVLLYALEGVGDGKGVN